MEITTIITFFKYANGWFVMMLLIGGDKLHSNCDNKNNNQE